MKNLKINKKILALAIFNMSLLTTTPNVTYAEEITNLEEEFSDINDYAITNKETSIKEQPTSEANSIATIKSGIPVKFLSDIEGYYEVLYNNSVGYINKNDATIETEDKLGNVYVVVDISDQNAKMYQDGKLIVDTPVVTGRPNGHSTPTGVYEIGSKKGDVTHDRYLVGPNYKSYVDYMMKFNGNIGLHDAEYHTDANGKKHGWRDYSEFGGETYLTNGSHGCVNMPHDAAGAIYNVVAPIVNEQGEKVKVIVKD